MSRIWFSGALETTATFWRILRRDGIALGFTADAWSRTMRSQAIAVAERAEPIMMRRGLELVPDATSAAAPAGEELTLGRFLFRVARADARRVHAFHVGVLADA